MTADILARQLAPKRPAPAVIIRLAIEARPQVTWGASSREEMVRLYDWVGSCPALTELVVLADAVAGRDDE